MADYGNSFSPCVHAGRAEQWLCRACLQANWARAKQVQEQFLQTSMAWKHTRQERQQALRIRESARRRRTRDRGQEPGDPPAARAPGGASTIYLWGYAPPQTVVGRALSAPTAAARQFAAARGWDEARPGAWARELPLPMTLATALGALEPAIRADPAVAGWGGRTSGGQGLTLPPAPARKAIEHEQEQETRPPTPALLWEQAQAAVTTAQFLCGALAARRAQARALRQRVIRIPILPDAAFESLNQTLTHALDQAAAGHLADGYTLLLAGLRQAQATAGIGWSWTDELVRIYRLALDNYAWRFGPLGLRGMREVRR